MNGKEQVQHWVRHTVLPSNLLSSVADGSTHGLVSLMGKRFRVFSMHVRTTSSSVRPHGLSFTEKPPRLLAGTMSRCITVPECLNDKAKAPGLRQ